MPYADVLVQLDTADARSRYEVAASLVEPERGQVTGLYLKTSLINRYPSLEATCYLPQIDLDLLIRQNDDAQKADASASAIVAREAAVAAGCKFDWLCVNGDAADATAAEARCADLVVMPPPTTSPDYGVRASAVDVALASGAPVLVVPEGRPTAAIGHNVLLAWNGSREAVHALRAAMPLLERSARVNVRMAHPRGAEPAGELAARLERHLRRHGLHAETATMPADEDLAVADWLKTEARDLDCDLIVMGVYGHTRVREFILGGVSRAMLHEPPLPIVIAH